jgi:hypothetical protein
MGPDYTNLYNTKLSPKDEQKFLSWGVNNGRLNDNYDYDIKGAYLNGLAAAGNGHFPDTYKKPNHPTFSNQSTYNGADGQYGGVWVGDKFAPSELNIKNMGGLAGYQSYGRAAEGGNFLVPSLRSVLY